MPRDNTEARLLKRFRDTACKYDLEAIAGQGNHNRLDVVGNTYFQFGDLRIEFPDRTVVVEVESAGGVHNLVKYWYLIDGGFIIKPITLFHIFQQSSKSDYDAHIRLWKFLWEKMEKGVGTKMNARCYPYRVPHDLELALADFDRELLLPPH